VDLGLSDLINGGAALVALHLATQINATLSAVKAMLQAIQEEVKSLNKRVTTLESRSTPAAGGPKKKARRAPTSSVRSRRSSPRS
jgi:hypothetical protein